MSPIVHEVVIGVCQIRRNEHLVDWARLVLRELRVYVMLVQLCRPEVEGHLIDLFSVFRRLPIPSKSETS